MVDLKFALAQMNPVLGDMKNNAVRIVEFMEEARERGADMVIFPELALTGYPPKDLLLRRPFIKENLKGLKCIIGNTKGLGVVLGYVDMDRQGNIYNAAGFFHEKKVIGIQHKMNLPNYDVFDEKRYFTPGRECHVFDFKGTKIGLNICEDIWQAGPIQEQAGKDAQMIINISASPFHAGKSREREEVLRARARESGLPIIYCNMVGGQDDLVFDGGSYVIDKNGGIIHRGKKFLEDLQIFRLDQAGDEKPMGFIEEVHDAIVLGIRDYIRKNGFSRAILGLSGGIDSSVTAALATRALGKENVLGVSLPSVITSKESKNDGRNLASNLGISFKEIPISGIFDSYNKSLEGEFRDTDPDVTEENLQARIRGNLLMAMSNKFGYILLSTGNKSETAVGYSTLYGDMAGGLAPISDVPKTMVYELAHFINQKADRDVIPQNCIRKAPTAELRPGQKDQDTLPPYDVLDRILDAYIEKNMGLEEMKKQGHDPELAKWVMNMVDRNEYKRKQAPMGIRITSKAFGFGRRMPITNKFLEE